ncbi:hypothetical protein DIZ27_20320 [Streptomyces sp. NWU339]|uniref:hypothetical protein n=1 Tax=Streptomyces sp. NWU339 TaxID=2185284 RepID=UPI000D67DA68|nr:hypothetical protein [Streptomyces sp. NWU339]PWI08804.1 hypothetical protein DIZ27_20320 [Streptomyces sp. NWU339]
MTTTTNVKSGKGLSDGVISELATYYDVLPGHEDELRAATQRFADTLRQLPRDVNIHTGLRDSRHVIFDNGRRLMWATTFENEWDAYVDDFVQIGLDKFLDWMNHTVQGSDVEAWAVASGGVEKFTVANPDIQAQVKRTTGGLKTILQSLQSPATGYFNNLSAWTMPQIEKAQRLQEAFQQVLDDPRAAEALEHPALRPLLDMAAD